MSLLLILLQPVLDINFLLTLYNVISDIIDPEMGEVENLSTERMNFN